MLPLILSLTLILGAGGLVYAMHARRELLQLAARAESAWFAVDDALARRSELVEAVIAGLDDPSANSSQDVIRLRRALKTQATVRESRDLLRLGSYERQIRVIGQRVRQSAAAEHSGITDLEQQILSLTDAYDACASVYNIRVQRLPTHLIARLDGLVSMPLIEFVEPFGVPPGDGESTSVPDPEC